MVIHTRVVHTKKGTTELEEFVNPHGAPATFPSAVDRFMQIPSTVGHRISLGWETLDGDEA